MIADQVVAGIDVSKGRLDVHVLPSGGVLAVANSAQGLSHLVSQLRLLGVQRVGLEASGGYERQAVAALSGAGLATHVVPPARVRALARALGHQAKTDPIDAAMIARYLLLVPASRPISPIRHASGSMNWPACAGNWWLSATNWSPGSTLPPIGWCAACWAACTPP